MYKQREIVLVPFPYSDLSTSKKRPVLIISDDDYNSKFADILVCVITSNLYKDEFSVFLEDTDLESGILPEKSVIKCHKLFTIDQAQILRKFSSISKKKLAEVGEKISQLIQASS